MVMCMKGASKLPPSIDLNLGSCAGAASLLGMQTPSGFTPAGHGSVE